MVTNFERKVTNFEKTITFFVNLVTFFGYNFIGTTSTTVPRARTLPSYPVPVPARSGLPETVGFIYS